MPALCDKIVEILSKMIARIAQIPLNGQQLLIEYMLDYKHSFTLSIFKGRCKCFEDEDVPPAVFEPQKKANDDAVANESSLQFVSEINALTNS